MTSKPLFYRVLMDLLILVSVATLALGAFVGYVWLKARPEHAKTKQELNALIGDMNAQAEGLKRIGSFQLDPKTMTLADLEAAFHAKPMVVKTASEKDRQGLGWACGTERCAIVALFVVPEGQEVPPGMAPAALVILPPPVAPTMDMTVGGIRLGENPEALEAECKRRGYGVKTGYNQVTWDKDWVVTWSGTDNKVDTLQFANKTEIDRFNASKSAPTNVVKPVAEEKASSHKN